MRIKRRLTKFRKDFRAIYVCEKCEHEIVGTGYDDEYFHEIIIPSMECTKCGYISGVKSSAPSVPDYVML